MIPQATQSFSPPRDDIHLVRRCLQGDGTAWETMVNLYGRLIRQMAYRYAGRRGEADDLTQEVFFQLYRRLETFRAESGSLQHWVLRVGRNLMIDRYRQFSRLQRFGVSYELEGLPVRDENATMPDQTVERAETLAFLLDCLQTLSPELKQALVMRYLNGMSYREMIESLDVPEGTVKSRISRGRSKLAGILANRRPRRRTMGAQPNTFAGSHFATCM